MAVITPQTDIYLLRCPLEISDINQLTFESKEAQFNYFNSLPKLQAHDYTYQRKDGTIRYGGHFDDVITYNYCMYRNDAYSDKWFYAYITDCTYLSDNSTAITIKTDPWQTWMFDLTFFPCLVDREHVNDDTVGKHTLPEGLELGEFVTNAGIRNFDSGSSYCVVVEVTQVENTGESSTLSYEWEDSSGIDWNKTPTLNGLIRGTTPLIVDYGTNDSPDFDSIRKVYETAGLSDSIVNVYPLPRSLVGEYHLLTLNANSGTSLHSAYHIRVPVSTSGVQTIGTNTFSRPTSIMGYVPKNGKVLTFPYCYFNISNNSGSSIPYHYEDFSGQTITFKTEGAFGVSGNVRAIPLNYKRISESSNSLDYSISGPKYPVASWKSDSYTNWLTQNAVNLETQWKTTLIAGGSAIAQNTLSGLGAMGLTGAGIGALGGGLQAGAGLINLAREQHLAKTQANMVPDQVRGNLNAGDFLWAKYRSPFTFLPMSIKEEYARCIDEYFSQFGYKCNRVKRPNITGRRNWNYVKTVGCYIQSNAPQEDVNEIKAMFDRGITLWHNPANFGNYDANNDII